MQQRKQLSSASRAKYHQRITDAVIANTHYQQAKHIACYHAYAGEVATQHIINDIHNSKKHCYLPVIKADKTLLFIEHKSDSKLVINQHGIAEAANQEAIYPIQQLDLIITPLVGFDAHCNRMGWGQGHYDRSFAFLNKRRRPTLPYLLGIAYECQKVDCLQTADWDIPLDAIISEQQHYLYSEV